MRPYTLVEFNTTKQETIQLLNNILLKLHDDDMGKEYDLIADSLDLLVDPQIQNSVEEKLTLFINDVRREVRSGVPVYVSSRLNDLFDRYETP